MIEVTPIFHKLEAEWIANRKYSANVQSYGHA